MVKEIDVFAPAYNEAAHIGTTIGSIHDQDPNDKYHFNVLVLPNGCTDDTASVASEAIANLPSHPSISFDVIKRPEASKTRAINFALGRCASDVAMYIDTDVTFSERCFEQVADEFADCTVQAAGPVPRNKIPPEIVGTYLGQILRVRQLYSDAAGPWPKPTGRLIAFRTAAIDALFEDTAADDTWLINTIAQNHGWESIRVAQDASVYATAQRNWLDYIQQKSRYARGNEHLYEVFPELKRVLEEGRSFVNRHMRSRAEIEEVIAPIMEKERLPMRLIDELAVIGKICLDNAELMPHELVSARGKWKPVASTKVPTTQEEVSS
ncbi:MAG TPA: glycosyltransferase family 2 protein [Candidatus Saccharimonadales bacterium]|nr:glycosyltransferase family 2 protein [Candidatus Saccharimonadales bacterium]